MRLRGSCDVNTSYIFHLLRSNHFIGYIERITTGANIPHISHKEVVEYSFDLPPLEVRKKIASTLSHYDDLIQTNQQRIALLEEAAQRLYDEWFVKLRFPNYQQVPVVDGVPEGWKKGTVGDLFVLQRGFDLPNGQRLEGNVPIYASTGINGFHNEAMVKNPTVITGRSGSLGTVLYSATPCWPLNTTLWVKEFKKASPLYTFFMLKSLGLEGLNGGSAVPTLNRNDVHRVEVISPPLETIKRFDTQIQPFFDQIENLRNYNQKLTQARDELLPRLMSGQLNVIL
jgi:type I restriction enzyme S subunit